MEKIGDPPGIQTQDLLNISQTLFTAKLLGLQQRNKDKLHKQHSLETSADSQSWTELNLKYPVVTHFSVLVLSILMSAYCCQQLKMSYLWC